MTKLERMEQLHVEWKSAKRAWEEAMEEMDEVMTKYCLDKSPPPSRKMLDIVDNLLHNMCESRGELDQFILEHAS